MNTYKSLTWGQKFVLAGTAVPMLGFGVLGGMGTYANIMSVFHRSATALGILASGEGATAVLALVLVGLTLLNQSSPTPVRIGLWILPAIASGTGAAVAQNGTDAIVYAVTPMAMCVSAEGMCLIARRIVVYTTGVDREAQRKNARIMQKIAYHSARAKNHPDKAQRDKSALEFWKLAKKVGHGDADLGSSLVSTLRDKMTDGADTALGEMFSPSTPVVPLSLETGTTAGHDVSPGSETTVELPVLVHQDKSTGFSPQVGTGSLSAYVKSRADAGLSPDQIRAEVREGTYEGTWSESGLKKAVQRYVPRSA